MRFASTLLLLTCCRLFGQTPTPPDKPTIPDLPNANSKIIQLVVEDQWDRGNDMFGGRQVKAPVPDWKEIGARDEQRHAQVRKLLQDGQLKSGKDFSFAALIFQHSSKAEDLMFGHILAVTAVANGGDAMAKWLAAATLDRYLNALGQSQVFGTQFHKGEGQPWTMDPYDRKVLSDSERALWCVIPLADQEHALKDKQSGGPGSSTQVKDCK